MYECMDVWMYECMSVWIYIGMFPYMTVHSLAEVEASHKSITQNNWL